MLKYCRKCKHLTQKQLETMSGVSQSYISKLEKCTYKHSPTLKQIINLSNALDIAPSKLSNWFISRELINPIDKNSSYRIEQVFTINKIK